MCVSFFVAHPVFSSSVHGTLFVMVADSITQSVRMFFTQDLRIGARVPGVLITATTAATRHIAPGAHAMRDRFLAAIDDLPPRVLFAILIEALALPAAAPPRARVLAPQYAPPPPAAPAAASRTPPAGDAAIPFSRS